MDKTPSISRYLFNLLRRLMFLWVKTTVQGQMPLQFGETPDPDKPIIYVLRSRSQSDLMVLEQECIKAGLPRPYERFRGHGLNENHSYFFLTKPEGLILQRERMYNSPRLDPYGASPLPRIRIRMSRSYLCRYSGDGLRRRKSQP